MQLNKLRGICNAESWPHVNQVHKKLACLLGLESQNRPAQGKAQELALLGIAEGMKSIIFLENWILFQPKSLSKEVIFQSEEFW
jgi:hypothetical protein